MCLIISIPLKNKMISEIWFLKINIFISILLGFQKLLNHLIEQPLGSVSAKTELKYLL